MFRRPRFRGLQQQQAPYESEDFNRCRCAVAAAGGSSLGRVMSNILQRVCRVALVQHEVSVMKKVLLAGIAVLSVLHMSVAHTCELEIKILKGSSLHVLEKCAGVETFHEDWGIYHPRGEAHERPIDAGFWM